MGRPPYQFIYENGTLYYAAVGYCRTSLGDSSALPNALFFPDEKSFKEFVSNGDAAVSDASAVRTKGATRVPSSSIACISFACGKSATLIWNVRREMPSNDSFTPKIFSATVSGSPTSSAPVGPSRASKCARVTDGQPRSFPISEKLRA